MRCGEFLRDLESRVAAPHDEDHSLRNIARLVIAGAVCLEDLRRELVRELRHVRGLKRPGCDDDLIGFGRPAVNFKEKSAVVGRESPYVAVQLGGKVERLCVLIQIQDHLVPARVALRIARERKPRQAAVAPGRKQGQRLPAIPPG